MTTALPTSNRLTSLDQFRGYTMLGMLAVNFLGGYPICPRILRHTNDYCSYADTIMPQFFFAAGFAMRLSLGRRIETTGSMPWGRAIRRILGLAAVAILWYSVWDLRDIANSYQSQSPDESVLIFIGQLFKRKYFQTLLHIAVTSLWILPVIGRSSSERIGFTFFTAILHLLVSWWFNFVWVYTDPKGIDGGPLGFLSWAIPALAGTLAYDAVRASGPSAARRIAVSGGVIALMGWLMSMPTVLYNTTAEQRQQEELEIAAVRQAEKAAADAGQKVTRRNEQLALDPVIPAAARINSWDRSFVEPPFVPPPDSRHRKWNYWMMSQRSGALSYLTFSAGLSLIIYAFFLWACDSNGWRLGIFRTLGTNSLAAYCFSDISSEIVSPWFPKRPLDPTVAPTGIAHWLNSQIGWNVSSSLYAAQVLETGLAFACFLLIVYLMCRFLERMGWYIRV